MKVLVTGGSGFVGEAIIRELLAKDFEVCALVNQNSELEPEIAQKSGLQNKFQILKADIRDWNALKDLRLPEKFDAVVHSAGLAHQFKPRDEQDFWDINVEGTRNICELAAQLSVKKFILISSVAVYGKASEASGNNSAEVLTEESECRPDGIYARTKFESERTAKSICAERRINLIVLRLATVIGENDRGNVARLIKAIDRRRFVRIGNGSNLKSLIYKGDVAAACRRVLEKERGEGIYNLTADALKMREIVGEIYRCLGRSDARPAVPVPLLKLFFRVNRKTLNIGRIEKLSEIIGKWLSDDVFSGAKFRKDYKFQIETPIKEAIRREVVNYLKLK